MLKVNKLNIIKDFGLKKNIKFLDITGWVEAEQMIRWKKEYPTWRLPKTSRLKKRGKNMPNMCSPTESKI